MQIMTVTVDSSRPGFLVMKTHHNEAIVAQTKTMPGCIYQPGSRTWTGPAEAVKPLVERLVKAKLILQPEIPEVPVDLGDQQVRTDQLYPHQKIGVEHLLRSSLLTNAGLLADDMGLGKSIQAIRAAQALNRTPVLILCPAIMVHKWIAEVQRWGAADCVQVGRKLKKSEGGGRLLNWSGFGVCSYDTFRSLKGGVELCKVLILDEVHNLSNSRSLRSKVVRAYLNRHHERPVVLALSGTPMTARPRDLWHPLDLMWPERFGSFWKFTGRYCGGHYVDIQGVDRPVWQSDGASNLDELGARLQGLMLRRTKQEVGGLPGLKRVMIPVELPVKVQKSIAKMELFTRQDADRVLLATEEHKIKAAVELTEELTSQGHNVLLFTRLKATAHELGDKLGASVVTGELAPEKRVAALHDKRIGVATVYSMTTGVDLTTYDVVVFVGLDWVPSTMQQAEARTHRIGQNRDVTSYFLIGLGTLDEQVQSKVIERLDQISEILGNAADEQELATTLRGGKSEQELLDDLFDSLMED